MGMLHAGWLYGGEFAVLGTVGILLALLRRKLFQSLAREAALEGGEKGRMLRSMKLRFEKGCQLCMEVHDIPVFVRKYLYQEKRIGLRLTAWRRLPERWTGLVLGLGIAEAATLHWLGVGAALCLNCLLAGIHAAALSGMAALYLEADSLWEQAGVSLTDYVANTLYPRQRHVYEGFRKEPPGKGPDRGSDPSRAEERKEPDRGTSLTKDEEQLLKEVLCDLLDPPA